MQKLKRAVIKEELVILTGNLNEAIVLNQLIFWSERAKDSDNFLQEEIARAKRFNDGTAMNPEDIKKTLLSGWVYKTAEEMLEETKILLSIVYREFIASKEERKQIIKKEKNELLQEEKRIREKYNPDNLFKNKVAKVETIQNSVAMVEYKESIFTKIKNWFKRNF